MDKNIFTQRVGQLGYYILGYFTFHILAHVLLLRSWDLNSLPRLYFFMKMGVGPNEVIVGAGNSPLQIDYRLISAFGRYGHMFLAGPWSIMALMQLNEGFRRKRPAIHRYMGRVFTACSLVMASAIIPIMNSHGGYYRSPSFPFLMDFGLMVLTTMFVVSGALSIRCAMMDELKSHRRWALRHVAIGHAVTTQRLVLQALSIGRAAGLPWPDSFNHPASKRAIFSFCVLVGTVINMVAIESWLASGPKKVPMRQVVVLTQKLE